MRISRSTGAMRKTGSSRVVIKKVANDDARRRFASSSGSPGARIEPIGWYSCAKTIASKRVSFPVRNPVQNERTEADEDRSHSSA